MNTSTPKTHIVPDEDLNDNWRDMFKSTETMKGSESPTVLET